MASRDKPAAQKGTAKENRRRKPRQQRSQRRVASILGAAGELLEEVGYMALTTNAIAAKARTSIGSLYQFFPNKDAVVAELVQDFRTELRSFFDKALSPEMARESITHFVDVVVDGIESLRDTLPGFSSVLSFRRFGGTVDDQRIQLETDIMAPLADLLSKAYPEVSEEQRDKCMRVVTETTKVLMAKAATENKETQTWMREELKRMLGLYLASYFGDGTQDAGSS